jgi:Icc-related predicted phosphoesterase
MTRIAAVGDLHFGLESAGTMAGYWKDLHEKADLFVIAGDLTRLGRPEEAAVLLRELSVVRVPIITVLGNHDYQSDKDREIVGMLRDAGVTVLEGDAKILELGGRRVGVAGGKGFGGGFLGACATEFGEPETKAFIRHTRSISERIGVALASLSGKVEVKIALLHYAPIDATIDGEKRQIYPFLGSYLLAEAIDKSGADICFHGHAHLGRERGVTPGGVPVRNVAQPVIRHAYNVYCLDPSHRHAGDPEASCGPQADSPRPEGVT